MYGRISEQDNIFYKKIFFVLKIRIGMHTGTVKAGIVGHKVPSMFVMGDTVTMASRLESHGLPDHVQISPDVYK